MEVGLREGEVGLRIHGERGADVEEDGLQDTGWEVHAELVGDAGSPVVRAYIECVVSQCLHHGLEVAGHLALGVVEVAVATPQSG